MCAALLYPLSCDIANSVSSLSLCRVPRARKYTGVAGPGTEKLVNAPKYGKKEKASGPVSDQENEREKEREKHERGKTIGGGLGL